MLSHLSSRSFAKQVLYLVAQFYREQKWNLETLRSLPNLVFVASKQMLHFIFHYDFLFPSTSGSLGSKHKKDIEYVSFYSHTFIAH